MNKIKVAAYMVSVRKLGDRKNNLLTLQKFDGNSDLLDVVNSYLKKNSRYKTVDVYQKAFKIALSKINSRTISGYIWMGDYGYATDIIDSTKGTVTHRKTKTEADPQPFFFSIAIPAAPETRAILCLQQTGIAGVKGILDLSLTLPFASGFPEYRLHVNGLVLGNEMERILTTGTIENVTLVKHEIPKDIVDHLGGINKSKNGTIKLTVSPTDSSFFKRDGLIEYVRGNLHVDDIVDFNGTQFDEITARVDLNGVKRTLVLSNSDRLAMAYDITNSIVFSADGFPTQASLKLEFDSITNELANRAGIRL